MGRMSNPSPALLTMLRTLRKTLETRPQFSESFIYFADVVVNEPSFHPSGVETRNETLEKTIGAVVAKVLRGPSPLPVVIEVLYHIPDAKFWHGAFYVHGLRGGLFYFEESNQGLSMIHRDPGQTEFVRFSAVPVPSALTGMSGPQKKSVN